MTAPKSTNAKETKVANDKTPTRAQLLAAIEERKLQNERDLALAAEMAGEILKNLCDKFLKEVEAEGFHLYDALDILDPQRNNSVSSKAKRTRAPNGTVKAKGPASAADSMGGIPERGATYKLPNGDTWTKSESGKGRAKDEFVTFINENKATWASLKV